MQGQVLLVEDNAVNAIVVRAMLESWGLDCAHAATGSEAIESFSCRTPALVLMDCEMPEMDGFEATRRIRARERAVALNEVHVPVIALTANAFDGDRERCLAAGMDDYLAKPFDRNALFAVIKRWLPAR